MRLPWDGSRVPHGTLDLLHDCNISCRSCYNCRPDSAKPYDQVINEFEEMLALRRLHTVSLTGGEATLHPDLLRIIQYIRRRKIKVTLMSNGLLLDSTLLTELKRVDLNLIMLHIQQDQIRSDLTSSPTLHEVAELRKNKIEIVAAHGIETGLSYTVHNDRFEELKSLVSYSINSQHANFVLFTLYRDFSRYRDLQGSLVNGYKSATKPTREDCQLATGEATSKEIHDLLKAMGVTPYAYVRSHDDPNQHMWTAFLCGLIINADGCNIFHSLHPSLFERTMIGISLTLQGRTPFLFKPSKQYFRAQLLLNGVMGGNLKSNVALFKGSFKRGSTLHDKHFLVQQGPGLKTNGEVIFCKDCPDATIRNGKLYPVCLADRIID